MATLNKEVATGRRMKGAEICILVSSAGNSSYKPCARINHTPISDMHMLIEKSENRLKVSSNCTLRGFHRDQARPFPRMYPTDSILFGSIPHSNRFTCAVGVKEKCIESLLYWNRRSRSGIGSPTKFQSREISRRRIVTGQNAGLSNPAAYSDQQFFASLEVISISIRH